MNSLSVLLLKTFGSHGDSCSISGDGRWRFLSYMFICHHTNSVIGVGLHDDTALQLMPALHILWLDIEPWMLSNIVQCYAIISSGLTSTNAAGEQGQEMKHYSALHLGQLLARPSSPAYHWSTQDWHPSMDRQHLVTIVGGALVSRQILHFHATSNRRNWCVSHFE